MQSLRRGSVLVDREAQSRSTRTVQQSEMPAQSHRGPRASGIEKRRLGDGGRGLEGQSLNPKPQPLRFSIPWVPPSNNVVHRMHWREQRRLVETAQLWILANAGRQLPRETERVRVRLTMYRRRLLDRDNLFGSAKPVFDALVKLGYAVDDRRQWMKQEVRAFVVRAPEDPCTWIEVRRI